MIVFGGINLDGLLKTLIGVIETGKLMHIQLFS